MPQSIIGALRVSLGLDSAQFEQGARRASSATDGLQKRFVGLARGIAATAAGYGITAAGLVAVGRAGAEAAREIENFSRLANAQPEVFQRWTAGAKTVGIEQGKLADILKDVNDRVGDFVQTGGGPMADFFENIAPKVGVTAAQFARLSGPEALQLYVSSLEKAKVNQQEMTFYMEAMASDSALLLPLLAANGAEMERLGDRAQRLGVVMDDSALASLRSAREAADRSSEAWLGLRNTLAVTMAPALEATANASERIAIALQPLIENLDRIAVYAGTAAVLLGGRLAIGIGIAAAQTLTLSGVLVTLRGALIRTGIGALVVGAGELVYQFIRLVKGAGGWGAALEALGKLAAGVWEGITISAKAIPPALAAIWATIQASFYGLLSDMTEAWSRWLGGLGMDLAGVPGFDKWSQSLLRMSGEAATSMGEFDAKAQSAARTAAAFTKEASDLANKGFDRAREAAAELLAIMNGTTEETEDGASAADRLNKSLDHLGGSGGGADKAGKTLEKVKSSAKAFADAMKDAAMTTQDWGESKAQILISGIDGVSNAFGDLVSRGFTDFKGFVSSILGSFQQMLSQMVAMAVRNRIMISLGFGGVKGEGFGGMLPGLGGGGSSGGGGSLLNLGSLLGGIGKSFKALGGLFGLGGGVAASGGFLATLGAAVPAIGLVGLAIGALIGKTTELDRGIRVTVNGMDALVETFRRTETSRLFGLLKSRSTSYGAAPAEIADPVIAAVAQIQTGVLDAAAALAIASDAFAGFSTVLKVSTAGMSTEDAARAVQDALKGMADEMADMVLAGQNVIRTGEASSDALTRLANELTAFNTVADTLGHAMFQVSIAGAAMASDLVAAFGGLDAFSAATSRYFAVVYAETERNAIAARQAAEALAEFNLAMPDTRQQYRAMVEAIDLTSERGRALYATMIGLADTMDAVLPAAQGLSDIMATMIGSTSNIIGDLTAQINATMRVSERAADDWYRTGESLRTLILDITGKGSRPADMRLSALDRQLSAAFAGAKGGDVDAARQFAAISGDYLNVARSQASSAAEYRRMESRVLAQANFLAGISELQGAAKDAAVYLGEQQLGVLNELNAYLQSVDTIDPADIASFEAKLGSLQAAIEQAEMFSYDYLQERLKVTVDLIPTADIPADVKTLMAHAVDGIRSSIDFAVKAKGLTPDLRWLAITGASEHIKTVDFLIGTNLPNDVRRLALDAVSSTTRTVNFVIGSEITKEEKRLALASSSELSRVINVTLGSGADPDAMKIALGNIGAYSVTIRTALKASPDVRKIVFSDGSSYAAMIEAAFTQNLDPDVRRVLLTQQGDYVVNVQGIIAESIPNNVKRLLLNANTAAIRGVTIGMAFSDVLTEADKKLLLNDSLTTLHTIKAMVNPVGITPFDVLFLDQLTSDAPKAWRTIFGYVNTRGIDGLGETFLGDIASGSPEVWREIIARIATGSLGDLATDFLDQLTTGDGEVRRAVRAEVWLGAVRGISLSYLEELIAGQGAVRRALSGDVNLGGIGDFAMDYYRQLRRGDGSVSRAIEGDVWMTGITGAARDFLNQLILGRGSIVRALEGAIYTGSITDLGKGLLSQLVAGGGSVLRGIKGYVDWSAIYDKGQAYLAQLFSGKGDVLRGVRPFLDWSDVHGKGYAYLDQLYAGPGGVRRGITGATDDGNIGAWGQKYLGQLFAGAGNVKRGVVGATSSGEIGDWGHRYLNQLFAGTGSVRRGISGVTYNDQVSDWGFRYLGQLFAGSGKVTRGITGATSSGDIKTWGLNYLNQLFAGTGNTTRGIIGATSSGKIAAWGFSYLDQLFAGGGNVTRGIVGATDGSRIGAWGTDYLRQLFTGGGTVSRGIVGSTSSGSIKTWGFNYLDQLFAGSGSVFRAIDGAVYDWRISGLGASFLDQLTSKTTSILRTIEGKVDLSALNARQLSLIDMIRGQSAGKITLGGGFVFDPSAAFSKWYETTTTANLTNPMAALRTSLVSLRQAVDFAANAQGDLVKAVKDAVAAVVPTTPPTTTPTTGGTPTPTGYTWADFKMIRIDESDVTYKGPKGGTRTGSAGQINWEINQIIAGKLPAFASGTSFAPGGLSLVGEAGAELVDLPRGSKVYSAPQTSRMLDHSDVVAAIARVERELAGLRDEQAVQTRAIHHQNKRSADTLENWNVNGIPAERAE